MRGISSKTEFHKRIYDLGAKYANKARQRANSRFSVEPKEFHMRNGTIFILGPLPFFG